MKITRLNWSSCLVLMLFVSSVPALAQHSSDALGGALGGTWNNSAGGRVTDILVRSIGRARSEKTTGVKSSRSNRPTARRAPSATKSSPPTAANAPSSAGDVALRYRPTGTYLKTQELASLISSSPSEREQIRALMETVLREYEKQALKLGHPNDLAMALSFFFAENSTVYHGQPEPPDPQILALRETIASILVESGALEGVTDRQKQEMYETLVSFTGLTFLGYQQAKQGGDEATAKIYQTTAGTLLEAVTHLSPDNINFDAGGLTMNAASGAPSSVTATNPDKVLAQLTELENYWDQANVKGDKDAINHILAEEFVGVAPDGTVEKKAQYLATLQPDPTITSQTLTELDLSLKGNTAILTGINTVRFSDGRTERFRFMDTFVWRDRRWQAISSQASSIK